MNTFDRISKFSTSVEPKDKPKLDTEQLVEWAVPEANSFSLKNQGRSDRMLKSDRARENRHQIRDIKQNKQALGYKL